jgi:hypothetical protein
MNTARRMLVPLLLPLAAACTTDGAVFVTKTSLSFADVDATPPEATVGLHRVEGFIAPRNRNGDTPPVLAHLQSNREFFAPNVQQVYATGTAAERLADDNQSDNSNCTACVDASEGRPITFATSTSIGFRVGLGSTLTSPIEGVMFGFRRKEMSYVPVLAKDAAGNYHYPSLIAAIRLAGPGSASDPRGFTSCQGFATGSAATALANRDDAGFGCLEGNETVKHMLTSKHGLEQRQQAEITKILQCYVKLPPGERRRSAQANAIQLGLLTELSADTQDGMMPTAASDLRVKTYSLGDDDNLYAGRLLNAVLPAGQNGSPAGTSATGAAVRAHLLRMHREYVCPKQK